MTLIHFKPKHHAFLEDLGFNQNNSGFYNGKVLSNQSRSDLESDIKNNGFSGTKSDLNHSIITYNHPEYPDLSISFRRIDKALTHVYIESRKHQPSSTTPVQGKLL